MSRWSAVLFAFGLLATFGCEPKPKPCRSGADCTTGTFCTVESGVCNPPPGCEGGDAVCPAVCYGTCEPRRTAACQTDADCRTFAFTCSGCECLALSTVEPEPTCPTAGVPCFADPCLTKAAVCAAGRCAITPVSCDAGFVARRVCAACGPAGGCAAVANCARVCQQNADCAADSLSCTDGVCQVVGCI